MILQRRGAVRGSGRLSIAGLAVAVALMALIPAQALAQSRDAVVQVSGRAMPWVPAMNPKWDFGAHDGDGSAMVWGLRLIPGLRVTLEAGQGGTKGVTGGDPVGGDGYRDQVYDVRPGASGKHMPAFYIDPASYPVNFNALVGAFVDADGRIAGRPFKIGQKATVEIPEGAIAISIGVNDDIFVDNSGTIAVKARMLSGSVTVEGTEKQQ